VLWDNSQHACAFRILVYKYNMISLTLKPITMSTPYWGPTEWARSNWDKNKADAEERNQEFRDRMWRARLNHIPYTPKELAAHNELVELHGLKQRELAEQQRLERVAEHNKRVIESYRLEKKRRDGNLANLFDAVKNGQYTRIVRQLGPVERPPGDPPRELDISGQDADGNTVLHLAALQQNYIIVEKLLEHGADPTIQNNNGETPFDLCGDDRRLRWILRLLHACG
jgi:Ankyrin repeats (many copies)